jgi:hypothetical protein
LICFCPHKCSNLLKSQEQGGVGMNGGLLWTHALAQLPTSIALPRQCPRWPSLRIMAPSTCLACIGWTQLGHHASAHMFTDDRVQGGPAGCQNWSDTVVVSRNSSKIPLFIHHWGWGIHSISPYYDTLSRNRT